MNHSLTPIEAHGPSEPGALAGFGCKCSCGWKGGSSIKSLAEEEARAHLKYWASREAAEAKGGRA